MHLCLGGEFITKLLKSTAENINASVDVGVLHDGGSKLGTYSLGVLGMKHELLGKLLPLPTGLVLLLSLLLLCLLVRSVAAVGAAGGGTHRAVTGIVAGDAAGDCAFNASLGVGGGHRAN